MENLPIPKVRSGWVAALLITVIVFVLYYGLLFGGLLRLYKTQFDQTSFEPNQSQLYVWLYIPHYFHSSEPISAFLYVQNRGETSVTDVEVYLITSSKEPPLLLPNITGDSESDNGVKIAVVEPHSVVAEEVSFIAQNKPSITGILLRTSVEEKPQILYSKQTVELDESEIRSLQHSFLENILLPPWSNGFILALVLFSVYLVRTKKDEELEPASFSTDWWGWVKDDVRRVIQPLTWMLNLTALFLLINESNYIPIICLIVLTLLLIARKFASNPGDLPKYLLIWGYVYAIVEFLWLVLIVEKSIQAFLIWLSFFILLVVTKVFIRSMPRGILAQFDFFGFLFIILGVLGNAWLVYNGEKAISLYIPWIILGSGGFITLVWYYSQVKSKMSVNQKHSADINPDRSSQQSSTEKSDETRSKPIPRKAKRKTR